MERWWIIFPAVILTCTERYKGECFVMSPSKQRVLPLCLPLCLSTQPQFWFWSEHVMSSFVILPLKCSGAWVEKQKLPKTSKIHGWWESAASVQSVLFPPHRLYQLCIWRPFTLPSVSCSSDQTLKTKKTITSEMQKITFPQFIMQETDIFSKGFNC